VQDSRVALPDGRTLAYTDIGNAHWPCVMLFGGAPSSRLRASYLEQAFLDARIRLVAPERPGYGGSSPQPGRSLADWPSDVAVLADALGLDRCIVAGHSSGGPYAVASAALIPARISAAVVLAGVTDMSWPDAWSGYNAMESELMRLGEEDAAVAWCIERLGSDGSGFFAAADLTIASPDEAFFDDDQIASHLAPARREAFRQGVIGYAQDIVIQGRPWPFDPGGIERPVIVVHGDSDLVVPLAHSQRTAAMIPGSHLHIIPGQGHFTILGELPRIAAWIQRSTT